MDKVVWALILISILFIITYNPKSGRIEQFSNIVTPASSQSSQCCDSQEYRANNSTQCENTYYQGVQFGNPNLGCPRKIPTAVSGVITAANM